MFRTIYEFIIRFLFEDPMTALNAAWAPISFVPSDKQIGNLTGPSNTAGFIKAWVHAPISYSESDGRVYSLMQAVTEHHTPLGKWRLRGLTLQVVRDDGKVIYSDTHLPEWYYLKKARWQPTFHIYDEDRDRRYVVRFVADRSYRRWMLW